MNAINTSSAAVPSAETAPAVPSRPASFSNISSTSYPAQTTASAYNQYNMSYNSPYSNPYGGYGSYSGMGSYGSLYNRFGSGMYGGMGPGAGPNGQVMGNGLQASTAEAFQLIESVVGAIGGFAQMLESTYMATHSSFFALVSVAEQLSHLKHSLGSILGIFTIVKWIKKVLAKITGKKFDATKRLAQTLNSHEFAKFQSASQNKDRQRHSFKPLLFFFASTFGFLYLLNKLIQNRDPVIPNEQNTAASLPQDNILMDSSTNTSIDPSTLEFCRALYPFVPENPAIELELNKGDLLAIISKKDTSGNASDWWRVRTRSGKTGYVPANYLEVISRQTDTTKPVVDKESQNGNGQVSKGDGKGMP